MTRKHTADRRVQRTRRQLHGALASLIREKDYEAIAVQEILDRADVGRSTFYTHFGDKDDLLTSGVLDLVKSSGPDARSASHAERLIRFSRPIFEHHDQHRGQGRPRNGARRMAHERLRQILVDLMSAETGAPGDWAGIPAVLLVEHVAATFILVLNWWLESGSPLTAAQVNEIFRRLVVPALSVTTPASRV